MSNAFDFIGGQAFPQQVTAVAFRWYEAGGVGDSSQPGFMGPFLQDANGGLLISIVGPNGGILLDDNADGVAPTTDAERVPTVARLYVYDDDQNEFNRARAGDDTFESAQILGPNIIAVETRPRIFQTNINQYIRAHANENKTAFTSAARTATVSSATFNNGNFRGGQFVIDVTAIAATPSVVFSVEAFDVLSGEFFSLLDSVAIVAVGTTVLRVYPGLTALINETVNDLLPWQWRVTATHADADSITYSVGVNLML